MALSGNAAYIGYHYAGLQVVDVSDPADPFLAFENESYGSIYSVDTCDNLLAVVSYSEVRILDISDPFNPVTKSRQPTGFLRHACASSGIFSTPFVIAPGNPILAYDISNSSSPVQCGTYAINSYSNLHCCDSRIFVAHSSDNIFSIDVSPAGYLTYGTSYPVVAYNLLVSDNTMYAVTQSEPGNWSELEILDLRNESAVTVSGKWQNANSFGKLKLLNNLLYVIEFGGESGEFRLAVLDVGDPANITALGRSEYQDFSPYDIAVQGSHVYVCGVYGLIIFDVSDPSSPAVTGRWERR